jgi:hypothetical protein
MELDADLLIRFEVGIAIEKSRMARRQLTCQAT